MALKRRNTATPCTLHQQTDTVKFETHYPCRRFLSFESSECERFFGMLQQIRTRMVCRWTWCRIASRAPSNTGNAWAVVRSVRGTAGGRRPPRSSCPQRAGHGWPREWACCGFFRCVVSSLFAPVACFFLFGFVSGCRFQVCRCGDSFFSIILWHCPFVSDFPMRICVYSVCRDSSRRCPGEIRAASRGGSFPDVLRSICRTASLCW